MVQALEDIQNTNKKRQIAFDKVLKERKRDILKAIGTVFDDYGSDNKWPISCMIDELVEAILKLDG